MTDTLTEDRLLQFVATRNRGVLAALKQDGRPQLSNINFGWDAATRTARVSVTAGRAKTRNLLREPRASLHVTSDDFWTWAVVEGTAVLTPPAADPHDATVDGLVELYRSVNGEHPDWDEFRVVMVADQRLVVRLTAEHVYGQLPW